MDGHVPRNGLDVDHVARECNRPAVSLGCGQRLRHAGDLGAPIGEIEQILPRLARFQVLGLLEHLRKERRAHGRGFRPGATVVISWAEREFEIPPDRTVYVDTTRIDVEAGLFPADTSWSVVVVDPDGTRSERFGFVVVE